MLTKEIKDRWLEALRSGKYQRGTGFLKASGRSGSDVRHCCLGVLAEIIAEERGWKWEPAPHHASFNLVDPEGEFIAASYLPTSCGLSKTLDPLAERGEQDALAEANDNCNRSDRRYPDEVFALIEALPTA